MIRPTTWIAVAAIATASLASSTARADGKNEIRAVSYDEDAGTTRVRVRGAQTPTFTVYKLERPSRVVIDVPQARLAEALRGHEGATLLTPSTWAVSTIAAHQLDEGGQVVRVIVTLARPGRYDVKTDGNEVVVLVTARDAAPKTASPEALAKVQAEREQARHAAATAEQARVKAERSSVEAQAEAERLRQIATEQGARAIAAQRAADDARRAGQQANHLALVRANAEATKARQAANAAQADAVRMRAEADQIKQAAARHAEAAARSLALAETAKLAALRDAEAAKLAAARDAEAAKQAAARESTAAKQAAAREAEAARLVAVREADVARQDLARTKADAEAARREVARAKAEALAAQATAAKQLDEARSEAALVKETLARTRSEAEAAKAEAARARAEADAERSAAAGDRKRAELARIEADRMLRDAQHQLASLDKKTQAAQALEDKARAASASAQVREEAARADAARAIKERELAEAAVRHAAKRAAASKSAGQGVALSAEARAAEARLAKARRATEEAEARRVAAETAAADARRQLDQTRTKLTAVEQARRAAESAAGEAARKRGEAEAAARDATRRRRDAELAATQAAAKRDEAEQAVHAAAAKRGETEPSRTAAELQRKASELAAREAKLAAEAADKQPAPVIVGSAQKPATPNAKLGDIRFHGSRAAAQVDIALVGDASITVGNVTATHAELIIDHADLATKLERKLDVTKFASPVRAVSAFRDRRTPNRVRLIAELARPATPTFDRDANGGVRWRFVSTDRAATAQRPPRTQNVPPPVVGGFGATSTPVAQQTVSQLPGAGGRRRIYRGATVDFDFKDAPIHDLLRIIADTGRVNIVVPDNIDAKVTVRLKRVPWDQALEVILASHGLWYRRDGNLYRIAPRKELDAEDEAEAARREALVKGEAPRAEIFPLNYASADELRPKLEAMLSPKGRIEVDARTNALIINDVAGNREQISRLALQLDTQTPQISIEARIVEARSTFVRQFGIQWGGRALAGAAGGNATGLIFPSSVSLTGANTDAATVATGVASPSDFAVNMPAATGSGEGGAIGLSLGSLGGNFNINLRLSALEDSGSVRIISAPKITVLNNKQARISQGVSIPISVISAAGTQTQFVQADLSLDVTPYVSQRDCAIAMNLIVTKNEPDFVNVGARGDPSILRKEAKTSMLVQDGETSVLGGIYTRNSGLAYKKVPFFADIPVLGWFFKNRRENDDRTEILVFITPKITNRALLRCQ